MHILFWEKGAGSIVVQALLEETGMAYERRYVDMSSQEHKQPGFLQLNPTGLVPALTLPGGRTIGESAAIVLYLGERETATNLVPNREDDERPEFLYWLLYMASTGYTTFGRFAHPERYTVGKQGENAVRRVAKSNVDHFFDVLENATQGPAYFLKSGYSALDIYLTMLAGWHPERDALFGRCPGIARICGSVEARKAYALTMADHA